jgi:prophage endopeptidase
MLRNLAVALILLFLSFVAGVYHKANEVKAEMERFQVLSEQVRQEANEQLKQEKQNAQAKIDSLQRDVADGTLRLYVRTSVSAASASGATENGAELDRQVAQDLISITADGDKAVIQLNSCIDFYNNLRTIK